MNAKNNIIFGKRSIVFFSILKVDGTKSFRGGVEMIITTKSIGNNAPKFEVIIAALMDFTIQLQQKG